MARRMLSLAAVEPRRWRSAPAVRCLQSTCNRSRNLSLLRSLGRAVQGQAELASRKALAIGVQAICWQPSALDTRFKRCSAQINSLHALAAKTAVPRAVILS